MERRLAAILAAAVVGYSRLMQLDDAGTLAALKRLKNVTEPVRVYRVDGTIASGAEPRLLTRARRRSDRSPYCPSSM